MELSEDYAACRALLPQELLCRIFAYLGVADRLAAGLTCKTWHKLTADSRIYGDVVVTLEKNVKERMVALSTSQTVVTCLVVKNSALDAAAMFWEHVGSTLKRLHFENCCFSWKEFASVLLKCPKLEHLAICRCDKFVSSSDESAFGDSAPQFFRPTPSGISSVDLSENADLSDSAFHQVMTVVGKLHALSLEGCALCVHPAIYRRFYPPGQVHSPLVLTFQHMLRSLEGAPLRVLNLSRTMIDNKCLAQLSAAYSKTLRELHAASCAQLGLQGVRALCENVPKLKCLNLGSNRQLKDNCLLTVCESLENLETLNMSNCTEITYAGFAKLAHLRKLQYASFSDCCLSDQETMVQLFSSRPWPAMRALNISSCRINDAVARCLAEQMPTLVSLDVSHTTLLTDDAVRAIWTHLRLLRVLRMERCLKLTDAALYRSGNLKTCEPTSMACLSGLKKLSLSGCYLVSDAGVLAAVIFKELTSLDVGHCNLLSSASLKHIALHCPSLSKLVLSFCVQLDDGALTSVLRPSTRLRHLNIEGCRNMTDTALIYVAQCLSVKYVNVKSCMVTLNTLQQLSLERQDLEVVHTVCRVE
ncbi:F-box/LRR-repeat protein fbxl-1 [Dermacentor silvarum]|uniref:F-box/LRR-repeat protein fbxl-1 n=1 Tax=Dermacentor silvarum TaxID=543639 RepID=UPI00210106AB|nr:F-box/LRR-repeat protein fbxl-1 [Dermacentor silvarum]